jgi:hypothetical protein
MITPDDFTPGARALRFDAEPHRYYTGITELTGCTSVLKGVGVSMDFEGLVERKLLTAAELAEKREIGKAAHAATHYYDEGSLRAETVDPRIEPYLQSWIGFREATGFKPALLETALWHPGLLLAGTIDRAGKFSKFEGCDPRDLYTVDIKLGDPDDAGAQWQTACYATMLSLSIARSSPWHQPLLGMRPRFSVQLQKNGHYKLHRYDDTLTDWAEYTHMVTTYRRQHARRTAKVAA